MGNPQPRLALENQIQAASERSHALEDHSPGDLER